MSSENENKEAETTVNPLAGLVDDVIAGDYTKANKAFGDAMGERIGAAIEQKKIGVAATVFADQVKSEEEAPAAEAE